MTVCRIAAFLVMVSFLQVIYAGEVNAAGRDATGCWRLFNSDCQQLLHMFCVLKAPEVVWAEPLIADALCSGVCSALQV